MMGETWEVVVENGGGWRDRWTRLSTGDVLVRVGSEAAAHRFANKLWSKGMRVVVRKGGAK